MANTDFILLILATIKIQSLARRHIAATKYRYLRMCVIYAQANCRGVIVRQHASVGREQLERARIITAVTTLQRAVRGMIDRVQVNVEVFAATEIQRSWRGYRSNANFMLTVMSAIKIQTFTRFVLAKAKLARLEKERSAAEAEYDRIELERILAEQRKNKLTHTSLPILKALSASSRTTQSLHAEAELFKLKNTVTSQCVGQMTTRFSLLPASVHAAMEPAEGVFRLPNGITQSSKFESLTAKAIRTLQKRKKFSEVLKAVMVMEKITSQSMYECRVIIDANAHEELISIICSCNRSSPHLELIRLILSVLKNLSQHPHLLSRLASDKTINTLTDVVHMFRDKPTPFVVASSLLERMLRGNHHLVPKYSKSENKKRLCGIVSLCKEKVSKLGDTKKGIRCLENIILICECELQTHLK
jgi:abnormal spindle-like microcephaly-associated protein